MALPSNGQRHREGQEGGGDASHCLHCLQLPTNGNAISSNEHLGKCRRPHRLLRVIIVSEMEPHGRWWCLTHVMPTEQQVSMQTNVKAWETSRANISGNWRALTLKWSDLKNHVAKAGTWRCMRPVITCASVQISCSQMGKLIAINDSIIALYAL